MRLKYTNPNFLAVMLVVILAMLIGCGKSSSDLEIGMLAPLTGAGASFGAGQRDGVLLAIDEINAAGGINGQMVSVIVEDTKTEPPTAVTAAIKLIDRHQVPAIIGSAASLDVPAYMGRLEEAHIPQLLPVAVLPKITEAGMKWTFRSAMNDRIAAMRMADFVANRLEAKSVGLFLENSSFGSTGELFGQYLEENGVKPLLVERFNRGDIDFSAQLTQFKYQKVTHIQFWGYYADYAQIARQIKQMGYEVQLMGNQAPVTDKTLELGGEALEGAINVCLFVPGSSDERAKKFVADFEAKYGYTPDTWAAQSYDGMYIMAAALKKAGADPAGIREALAATRDFEGITGTISFNEHGDAEFRGTSVVIVKDGVFVPYDELVTE